MPMLSATRPAEDGAREAAELPEQVEVGEDPPASVLGGMGLEQ